MRGRELFGGPKRGDEGPVVSRQHNGTSTGLVILDDLVSRCDAFLVVCLFELLGEVVLAYGTDVDDVVGGEDVGGCSGAVLGCSTGDVSYLVILDDIIVATTCQL